MFKENSDLDGGAMPMALPGFEHINRYWDTKNDIFAAKIMPGEYYVSTHGEMIATVLGSCVSACIRDTRLCIGGMNHFMLPDISKFSKPKWVNTPVSFETRYGNVAMERLINVIIANGGNRKHMEVKLFGGSKVLDVLTDIGGKNIEFVRHYLDMERLKVAAIDVGGTYPRKVLYYPSSGRVKIKKLKRMHNDTLIRREQKYIADIKDVERKAKVDIF